MPVFIASAISNAPLRPSREAGKNNDAFAVAPRSGIGAGIAHGISHARAPKWAARARCGVIKRPAAARASRSARKQQVLIRGDAEIAQAYAKMLDPLCRHLVVSQNRLPHLWRLGVLGGRSFDVLIER